VAGPEVATLKAELEAARLKAEQEAARAAEVEEKMRALEEQLSQQQAASQTPISGFPFIPAIFHLSFSLPPCRKYSTYPSPLSPLSLSPLALLCSPLALCATALRQPLALSITYRAHTRTHTPGKAASTAASTGAGGAGEGQGPTREEFVKILESSSLAGMQEKLSEVETLLRKLLAERNLDQK